MGQLNGILSQNRRNSKTPYALVSCIPANSLLWGSQRPQDSIACFCITFYYAVYIVMSSDWTKLTSKDLKNQQHSTNKAEAKQL